MDDLTAESKWSESQRVVYGEEGKVSRVYREEVESESGSVSDIERVGLSGLVRFSVSGYL